MNIREFQLPKTYKAIQRGFPGEHNRKFRWLIVDRAYQGEIGSLGDVALSASGHASVAAIRAVFTAEMQELGLFDRNGFPAFHIGEDANGVAVAFMDQPVGVEMS
jgi:hypothetical protein